jgi:hypothetical protein
MKLRLTPEELAKAHDGLCGVSIGDGPCSCLVHWIEALQGEADKLKLEKRGFQIMTRRVADATAASLKQLVLDGKYERAGGDVECDTCRLQYFEHPQIPEFPTFHLICSGKVVKT